MRVRIPLLLPSALAVDVGTVASLDAGILVCIVLVTLICSYSFFLALLAQWTEHRASIPLVEGSNPSGRTTFHSSSMAEPSAVYLTLLFFVKKTMNSKQKGNITELETMLAFLKLGYNVLTPYGDCERYDFVVDANGKFIRVQAKTSSTEDDGASFKFSCRSCHRKDGKFVHHKYSNEEVDYFATTFNGKSYLIPVEECGGDKRLRILPTKNGQTRGVALAKNYELEEVIKNW